MMYFHERENWPDFRWNSAKPTDRLAAVRYRQGRLVGRMESLGFELRAEAVLRTLTEDILKSSEIEGELLDKEQVRSSIERRLGMDIGAFTLADRNVEGVVEMMIDATRKYNEPLTNERLAAWHAALFPTGYSGMTKITVGAWRTDQSGLMQVVSGPMGHEHVHFQAPAAKKLEKEMNAFLNWFNADTGNDFVLKAQSGRFPPVVCHPPSI